MTVEQVQLIARALADPRRYQILRKLRDQDEKGIMCQSLLDCSQITAATLSHHMKELEIAQLVTVERKGKFACYRLRKDVLKAYFSRIGDDLL